MVHRPKLLFLDEPTTGLDPQSRARLWEEVRQLRAAGTTIFLTTHYLEEADALADRLAIMDEGRIVVEGTPDSLKQQIAGDVVTLGLEAQNGQFQTGAKPARPATVCPRAASGRRAASALCGARRRKPADHPAAA